MDNNPKTEKWLVVGCTVLIAFSVALRFVNLDNDTPLFYSGYGASEISDPYIYTSHARDRILHGDWDPWDFTRWKSFRTSAVSIASFLVFSTVGVSREAANVSGLLLHLTGIGLFLMGWRKIRPLAEVIFCGFFLTVSSIMFFASRLPLLESGVIFLLGLTVYCYFSFRDRLWGVFICGILVSTSVFAGKLTAVMLLAPILFDVFMRHKNRLGSFTASTSGGVVLGALIFSGINHYWSPLELVNYYQDLLGDLGRVPQWPGSAKEAVEMVFSFGSTGGLFRFSPILILTASVGLILSFANPVGKKMPGTTHRLPPGLVFVLVWVSVGILASLPFPYRPYRYFLQNMLPLCAIAAFAIAGLIEARRKISVFRSRGIILSACIAIVVPYLFVQFESWWSQFAVLGYPVVKPLNFAALFLGVIVAGVMIFALRLNPVTLNKKWSRALAVALVLSFGLHQSFYIAKGLFQPASTLKLQVREIGELYGEDAILSGAFAPAFTIDNRLNQFYFPIGIGGADHSVLEKKNVTHIAEAAPVFQSKRSSIPILRKASPASSVWAREAAFKIYDLRRENYSPTDYELAMRFIADSLYDSALVYFDRFIGKYQQNLTARLDRLPVLLQQSLGQRLEVELRALAKDYSNIYYARYQIGKSYFMYWRSGADLQFLRIALENFEAAIELNPYIDRPLKLSEQIRVLRTAMLSVG